MTGLETVCCWIAQVHQRLMADDIVEDFDAGLEYAEAESVLRIVQRGDQRQCLVRWDRLQLLTSEHCLATGGNALLVPSSRQSFSL